MHSNLQSVSLDLPSIKKTSTLTLLQKPLHYVLHWYRIIFFIDGNKRLGHAAIEIFKVLNDYEIIADVNEQERVMIDL